MVGAHEDVSRSERMGLLSFPPLLVIEGGHGIMISRFCESCVVVCRRSPLHALRRFLCGRQRHLCSYSSLLFCCVYLIVRYLVFLADYFRCVAFWQVSGIENHGLNVLLES